MTEKQQAKKHKKWLIARQLVIDRIAEVNQGWEPNFDHCLEKALIHRIDESTQLGSSDVSDYCQTMPKAFYIRSHDLSSRLLLDRVFVDNYKIYLGIE